MKARRLKQRAWKHKPNSGAQVQYCGPEQWDVTISERRAAMKGSPNRPYAGSGRHRLG